MLINMLMDTAHEYRHNLRDTPVNERAKFHALREPWNSIFILMHCLIRCKGYKTKMDRYC